MSNDEKSLKLRLYVDMLPRKTWREPVYHWPVITSSPTALNENVSWQAIRDAFNARAEAEVIAADLDTPP